ncbi:uncharacterized protein LOC143271983 isoform X9 [Peromyscus maniculatus bairdii]|uniref:uncharacterized protein LOC143271983 isoform X9 n=1 Tax=Peromyscus maniculatus bairdii TaxID=230844 RepID=UPI003FD26E2C
MAGSRKSRFDSRETRLCSGGHQAGVPEDPPCWSTILMASFSSSPVNRKWQARGCPRMRYAYQEVSSAWYGTTYIEGPHSCWLSAEETLNSE